MNTEEYLKYFVCINHSLYTVMSQLCINDIGISLANEKKMMVDFLTFVSEFFRNELIEMAYLTTTFNEFHCFFCIRCK